MGANVDKDERQGEQHGDKMRIHHGMDFPGVGYVPHQHLRDNHGRDFTGELPPQMGKVEHEEKTPQTEGVVHAGGALEGGQGNRGGPQRLLFRVVVGGHELGGVGHERGENEGHEKGIHAGPLGKLVEDVDLGDFEFFIFVEKVVQPRRDIYWL